MEWIDSIVIGLIEMYGTRDVYELCDVLEIEVRSAPPSNIMLHGHKSHYYRYFDNSEVIFIDETLQAGPEKDFILKHELGHALCNPDITCAAYSNKNIGKIERQANYFALKLSNLEFDVVAMYQMTYEQISAYLHIPYDKVCKLLEDKFTPLKTWYFN